MKNLEKKPINGGIPARLRKAAENIIANMIFDFLNMIRSRRLVKANDRS
jgi:hypothetical protein